MGANSYRPFEHYSETKMLYLIPSYSVSDNCEVLQILLLSSDQQYGAIYCCPRVR